MRELEEGEGFAVGERERARENVLYAHVTLDPNKRSFLESDAREESEFCHDCSAHHSHQPQHLHQATPVDCSTTLVSLFSSPSPLLPSTARSLLSSRQPRRPRRRLFIQGSTV